MNHTVFSGLLLMALLTACQSTPSTGIIVIDINEALKNPGSFVLSDLVEDVEIITLDTVPDAYFRNLGGLTLTDNFICFACDIQKRVYLFDRDGKFIRHIGRKGKGPGEFVRPNNIAVSPDETHIVVGDARTKRIILYDINGRFIRERNLKDDTPGFSFEEIIFTDNTHFMISIRRPVKVSDNFASILIYNLDLEVIKSILPRPANEEEAMPNLLYSSLGLTQKGFYFWETLKDTVYYFDKTGKTEPRYYIKINNRCKETVGFDIDNKACIKEMSVLDLPDILLINLMVNGGSGTVMYDKKSTMASRIDHPTSCDTASNSWVNSSIINDVFGLEPTYLSQYNPEKKEIITLVRPGWTIDSHDMNCLRSREVKFPAIRDRLADLSEDRLGQANAAIVVMKLK